MEISNSMVAWVVGGSSGLGLAVARALLAEGYRVSLFARDEERLTAAATNLRREVSGARVETYCLDATDVERVSDVFEGAYAASGRVDLLVNALGQSCRSSVWQPDMGAYRRMMDVNYFSVVHTSLKALPWLADSGGSLVNIATLAAKTAWPWIAPYGASKAALANFTDNLRLEAAGKVHVLLVCPGPLQREDSGQRYADQAAGLSAAANLPGAGAPVRAICPQWLAQQIVMAIKRRRLQLIYPNKFRWLMLANALSSRLGFWLTRRLNAG
jgi:short-subunit dehydrogenase